MMDSTRDAAAASDAVISPRLWAMLREPLPGPDRITVSGLQANAQIVFRYCEADGTPTERANPNGSLDNVAGIRNAAGNVLGLMPHPERGAESILGNEDGRLLFHSLINAVPVRESVH